MLFFCTLTRVFKCKVEFYSRSSPLPASGSVSFGQHFDRLPFAPVLGVVFAEEMSFCGITLLTFSLIVLRGCIFCAFPVLRASGLFLCDAFRGFAQKEDTWGDMRLPLKCLGRSSTFRDCPHFEHTMFSLLSAPQFRHQKKRANSQSTKKQGKWGV